MTQLRILYLADRLSVRGGADWHFLGVLRAAAEGVGFAGLGLGQSPSRSPSQPVSQLRLEPPAMLLAVGRDDSTARAPCPVVVTPMLDDAQTGDSATTAAQACDTLVREFAPNVIHLHNITQPQVLAWAAEQPNAVLTVQDHRPFCPGRGKLHATETPCTQPMSKAACKACVQPPALFDQRWQMTHARLQALRQMPRVVVLSAYMQQQLVEVGLGPPRVTVIPPFVHGLPDAALGPAARASAPTDGNKPYPCVLFSGRLVTMKGVDDAVAAWRASGVDLPLVFCGTGRRRNDLEAAGFHVTGWLPHDALQGWLRAAAVLVMPSRWAEPFGISGVEALSQGTPVAAYDSGGIAEWHPGPVHGLAPWGDVEGLASAIAQLAQTSPPGEGAAELTPRQPLRRHDLMAALAGCYQQATNGPSSPLPVQNPHIPAQSGCFSGAPRANQTSRTIELTQCPEGPSL